MGRHARQKFDIYKELCPVSAVAVIGSGLVVLAMGDMIMGGTLIFSGFIVGAMAPVGVNSNVRQNTKHKH